jgi:hypothetical protein
MDVQIGQWADYLNYDPDGLCGPPTPRDPELEDYLFGPIAKIVRKTKESNEHHLDMCKVTCAGCGDVFEVHPAESNANYPGAPRCWKCRAIWEIEHPVKPEVPPVPPTPISLREFLTRSIRRWLKESS